MPKGVEGGLTTDGHMLTVGDGFIPDQIRDGINPSPTARNCCLYWKLCLICSRKSDSGYQKSDAPSARICFAVKQFRRYALRTCPKNPNFDTGFDTPSATPPD